MEQFYYAKDESGLSREEIRAALQASLEGKQQAPFVRAHDNDLSPKPYSAAK